MTGAEVRELCLGLPETTEKETWGDGAWAGTAPKKLAGAWRASR